MEEKKKSFNLVTLILIGIIVVLGIIGLVTYCMNVQKEENVNENLSESAEGGENFSTSANEETTEFDYAKIYPDKELVFSDDFCSIEVEENDAYSRLYMPVINLNFEEIKKINSEIEDFYNKNKVFYQNEMENSSNDVALPTLYYTSSLINGILNVVFYRSENYENSEEYYYIDIKNEKLLSNEEFLNKLGIGEKELEALINDTILKNYYYVNGDEFLEKEYKSIEEFRESIKYNNINNEGISEKYEYDFEKICNFCNMRYYNDLIYIDGISMPLLGGTDSSSNEADIYINLNREYVFEKIYSFNVTSQIENTQTYILNKMPVINLNSDDAKKINSKLSKFYDKLIQSVKKNNGEIILGPLEGIDEHGQKTILDEEVILNKEGKVVIDNYYTMNFGYTIINDSVLSIIVEEAMNKYSLGVKSNKNLLYNFDIETGKLLTNEEFIEKCGINLSDFKTSLNTKLKLMSDNKEIKYNINDLEITFEDPGKLFFLPENKANTYEGYLENEFGKFAVLGKGFPNYPSTWVDVYIDETKDEQGLKIKEENEVLDTEYIDSLIENYDTNNRTILRTVSDTCEVNYYLIDFEKDSEPECIVKYNYKWYVYCKGHETPTLISWDTDYNALYEVKNKVTDETKLILKSYRTYTDCFENMSISSIVVKDNRIFVIPVFGYSCDTEKEKELRKDMDNMLTEKPRQEIINETHTIRYSYNDWFKYTYEIPYENFYGEADSLGFYCLNDNRNLPTKEQYDEYINKFKENHELIHEFKLK